MTCKSKGRWYMFFVGKKIPYNVVTKLYGVSLTLCSLNIQNIFTTSKYVRWAVFYSQKIRIPIPYERTLFGIWMQILNF